VNDIVQNRHAQAGSGEPEEPEATALRMLSVPNLSEGRDEETIAILSDACRVPGAAVIDRHTDRDHNRTVLSLAGTPSGLCDALVSLAAAALERIDLRRHRGVHPCTGALDVVPIVVLGPGDPPVARAIAEAVGQRIGHELDLPVFFYGDIATTPELERPYGLRAYGPELLSDAISDGRLIPDAGPPRLHPTAGCVLVGVRPPLIAWNVALPNATLAEARAIADRVRESGGGVPGVRALGLYLPEAGIAQVSMNLEDSRSTPPWVVMQAVRREADRLGVELGASELVGLMPRHALGGVSPEELGLRRFAPSQLLEARCPALARDEI
jgi:glutamate formiminotransferase